jgi:hypothetical protein
VLQCNDDKEINPSPFTRGREKNEGLLIQEKSPKLSASGCVLYLLMEA